MQRAFQRPAGCLSDLAIDRLITGELDRHASATALAHAAECAWCTDRLDALRGEQRAFAARPVPLFLRRRPRVVIGASAVLAAAAALALVVGHPDESAPEPTPAMTAPDLVRSKGGGAFGLYVERGGLLDPLLSGERIAPGERVQPTYRAGVPGYLAIFGIDASGRVAQHFPADVSLGTHMGPGPEQRLPLSLTFDAAPGREVLIAVFCPHPLDTAAIAGRLADDANATPDPACTVESIELHKDGR